MEGKPAERRYIFEHMPKYFAFYYFTRYFDYDPAPFHDDMWGDYTNLMNHDIDEAAWIMFRESAKTSLAKIAVIHAICFEKKYYINWDSKDKSNAEQALFDIALELQTNDRLINDFGQLYNEPINKSRKSRKRVGDFITSDDPFNTGEKNRNPVRVSAFSTGTSMRGRVIADQRPDWLIMDDFENEKTIESPAQTDEVIKHIDSAQAGMAPTGCVLYLGNYISDTGSVDHILSRLKDDPKAVVRNIPVVDEDGNITWPDKYVFTDEDAVNSHDNPAKRKVSLETKKRKIDNYEAEMMNNPYNAEDLFFDRTKVNRALDNAREPEEINAGLYVFEDFKPNHRYALGADVAEGGGRDSSSTAIIDFDTGELVAAYEDNRVAPDVFGSEIIRQAMMYGKCLVAPERNAAGVATVIKVVDDYTGDVFIERKEAKIGNPMTKKYGWRTTKESKSTMLFGLKKAFEDGKLTIYDKRVLEEMKIFTRQNFTESQRTATRHFDMVTALAIAWQMRDHAEYPEDTREDQFNAEYKTNKGL